MNKLSICEECFAKQQEIDQLKQKVENLQQQLNANKKRNKQGYFGSSTPSSKIPVKANSLEENQKKKGGAKKRHKGNGRESANEETADRTETLYVGDTCPDCGGVLSEKETFKNRTTIECAPVKAEIILNVCGMKWCPNCKKTIIAKPDVMDNCLYGNELITQAMVKHYGNGIPMGKVEKMFGDNVNSGSLFGIFHRVSDKFRPVIDKLVDEYRISIVKQADETGWRNDGAGGYAWLFCNSSVSIFKFEDNRSSKVPEKVLGTQKLPGVLVVDRYNGYNRAPCKIQYCYAHLLRAVKDLENEFEGNKEIQNFVDSFAPLLAQAMGLRAERISNKKYYKEAKSIKRKMLKIINSGSQHMGIKNIQDIFTKNKSRLYHWVENRKVPAENNRSERELRPTVIARKVSFGSQSVAGLKTREVLMSILHTVEKRLQNQTLEVWLKNTLDMIAKNPNIDLYPLIPKADPP